MMGAAVWQWRPHPESPFPHMPKLLNKISTFFRFSQPSPISEFSIQCAHFDDHINLLRATSGESSSWLEIEGAHSVTNYSYFASQMNTVNIISFKKENNCLKKHIENE